jgi:hypothetical protein
MTRHKHKELLELMNIPEIEEIMLAKLAQVKLMFKDEIRDSFRDKRKNIIDFPAKQKRKDLIVRRELGEHAILIDTTNFKTLSQHEKIEILNQMMDHDSQIREMILNHFFVKILPFIDSEVMER